MSSTTDSSPGARTRAGTNIMDSPFYRLNLIDGQLKTLMEDMHGGDREKGRGGSGQESGDVAEKKHQVVQLLAAKVHLLENSNPDGPISKLEEISRCRLLLAKYQLEVRQFPSAESQLLVVLDATKSQLKIAQEDDRGAWTSIRLECLGALEHLDTELGKQGRVKRWKEMREKLELNVRERTSGQDINR